MNFSVRLFLITMAFVGVGLCPAWADDSPQSTGQPTSHSAATHKPSHHSKKAHGSRKRGQQKIDAQRATQIQQALIREHYLSGKPSGNWDAASQQAMQKYQADNGWQSKTTPDSRALIKLGLGPDQQHLLNPESAMTTAPHAAQGQSSATTPVSPSDPTSQPQR